MSLTVGIAGAGIAGLALAAGLERSGIAAVVFERQPEVRDGGAGISLWPNALAALDTLGLGDLVRGAGCAVTAGGQRSLRGRTVVSFSTRRFERALGEGLVCVERGVLVRVLSDQLAPGTVRAGRRVAGFETDGAGVTVLLAGGEEVRVDALVGADGFNSAVARQLCGPLDTSYSGYTAWRGIAVGPRPDHDHMWACLAGGHEVGWLPVGPDRTYWFATACLPANHVLPGGDLDFLRDTFEGWPEPVGDLLAATAPTDLARNDIVDRAAPGRWSHGPVTLIGDAAHPMRPHLGQGGCQAMEDAAAACARLLDSPDPTTAFARYEEGRAKRARLIVGLSRRSGFTRVPGPAGTALDRLSELLPEVPLGPGIRLLSPIAGYRAGARAVRPPAAG